MDRVELRRLIRTADAAGIPTSTAVLAKLARVDELASEVVGEQRLGEHRQRVAREVADRVLADQAPDFVAAWSEGESALSLEAWRGWKQAQDLALHTITAEVLAELRPGLIRAWGATILDVGNSYRLLAGDVSVPNALTKPKPAQQGCDAVVRLAGLVALTDLLLRAAKPEGARRDWRDAALALHPDQPVDWSLDALALLGAVGAILAEHGAPDDPIEARFAEAAPAFLVGA